MARLPLLLAFALAAAVATASEEGKARPVMKVVRMLQDMKRELEADLEDDKAVHEKLTCWCETNDRQKTQAIAEGEARENQLTAFLGEAAAKMKEMKTKRDATLDEVDRDYDALGEASALRRKENQEFHAEDVNLMEAAKACGQAVTVLSEHNPALAQVRAAAQRLQNARVLSFTGRSLGAKARAAVLKDFLSHTQGSASFLAVPGFQSYAPQSGQIFGVLKQMKADFEADRSDAQAKEKKAQDDFLALKAAKEEEMAAGRKLVAEFDQEIADLKAKHAQAFQELDDTQAQLELDRPFLATLKEKCSMSGAEFDKRVKDRLTEIAAVEDTIGILNTDTAFDNFETTVNSPSFLQLAAGTQAAERERMLRGQASASLERAAGRFQDPSLALLATRAQLDAFTKVKEEIDKMVAELNKQQADEVEHRDWCIDEMNKNNRSTEEGYDQKDSLTTKIVDLKKTIATLAEEIEAATQAVTDAQEQMKRASENREAENADYQQTITDQRLTQMILDKALTRMRQVYAFLQARQPGAPHVHTSGNHTDPGAGPARFAKYEQNTGGSKVVGMIEEVIADSRQTEDDAIAAEEDAQTAYENFMKDSNKAITAATRKIVNMEAAKATATVELTMAEADLKSTMNTLEELNSYLGDLRTSCDYVMKNFEARQAARAAEVDALKEAKGILSGMQ